jgi:hypothetical protein
VGLQCNDLFDFFAQFLKNRINVLFAGIHIWLKIYLIDQVLNRSNYNN